MTTFQRGLIVGLVLSFPLDYIIFLAVRWVFA